jgi:hypothetical protein
MAALEGYGPSEPLPAVNQHPLTAPTERTPSSKDFEAGINLTIE